MNTKEAIRKVKDKYEGWQGYARTQEEVDKLGEERDEVIELLQCGGKYRHLLLEIKKIANDIHYHNDGEQNCEYISELIEEEFKYKKKNH